MTDAGAAGTWVVVVRADRDHHELVLARAVRVPDGSPGPPAAPPSFPVDAAEREVVLTGDEVRIGRDVGDGHIDLSGPPLDPGVSHRHAVLMALPTGRWVVLDTGSTNGTTLNYGEDPLPVDRPVPLRDGDTVHVGAWTTLTVRWRRSDPSPAP